MGNRPIELEIRLTARHTALEPSTVVDVTATPESDGCDPKISQMSALVIGMFGLFMDRLNKFLNHCIRLFSGSSSIIGLFLGCRPSAVVGMIITIVVYAVNRLTFWAFSHVF